MDVAQEITEEERGQQHEGIISTKLLRQEGAGRAFQNYKKVRLARADYERWGARYDISL